MTRTCELCRNTLCMDVNRFSGRVKIKDGELKRTTTFIKDCDVRKKIIRPIEISSKKEEETRE